MKELRSKRWFRGLIIAVIAMILLAGVALFLGIRGPQDVEAYREMASGFPPVWKDLAFRRYGKGDSVTNLLKGHPAAAVHQFGVFSTYSFVPGFSFSGIGVATKDGKLISAEAGSCTWHHQFFEDTKAVEEMNAEWQRRYTSAQACTNRLIPLLEKETRFDFVQVKPFSTNIGNVRISGLVGSETDYEELKRLVTSADPPFGCDWSVRVNPDYRTNQAWLRNPPPISTSRSKFRQAAPTVSRPE